MDQSNLEPIENFLKHKLAWVERAKKKEDETKVPTKLTLTGMLLKELEVSVDKEEEAYANMLAVRTFDEKHEAILKIAEARKKAEEGVKEEPVVDDQDISAQVLKEELQSKSEDEDEEDDDEEEKPKEPRKKGYLETTFDEHIAQYLLDPSEQMANKIMSLTQQMEVNRRVRFFYDLQKLRVAADLRKQGYERVFGIKDLFIDHTVEQLKRMEHHNEKMVDRILERSPDRAFYRYLVDTYTGVGTMMSGCMISEFSAPERFATVGKLWKYCGLDVVIEQDTGNGHARRRAKGEKAQWNHFIRTKLLGVLTGCMIKAQTRYIDTPEERTKGRNVKCLNDYKHRITQINNLVGDRYYTARGKEIFRKNSVALVVAYRKGDKKPVTIKACDIPRRAPGHLNNMAKRYMVKMFLIEILNEWRKTKGYAPLLTYDEAKLRGGRRHGEPDLRSYQPQM